jgi:hypothetical protein
MNLAVLAVFIFAVCLAALEDVRLFKIPNWASATVAARLRALCPAPPGLWDIGMHLIIAAVIFVITATFWKLQVHRRGRRQAPHRRRPVARPGPGIAVHDRDDGRLGVIALALMLVRTGAGFSMPRRRRARAAPGGHRRNRQVPLRVADRHRRAPDGPAEPCDGAGSAHTCAADLRPSSSSGSRRLRHPRPDLLERNPISSNRDQKHVMPA